MGICIIGVALGVIGDYVIQEQARISKEVIAKAQNLALGDYASSDEEDDAQPDRPKALLSGGKSVIQIEKDRSDIEQIMAKKNKRGTWLGTMKHVAKKMIPLACSLTLGVTVMLGSSATDVDSSIENESNCTSANSANIWDQDNEECRVLWTFIDGLYWAVVTGTTVGYGDLTPESQGTKWFGMLYLLISVVVTAKSLSLLGDWVLNLGHVDLASSVLDQKLSEEYLLSLDEDGNGQVSEFEYLTAMLVRLKYVQGQDIDRIMKTFRKLDKDGSGTLSVADLAANLRTSKVAKRKSQNDSN